MPSIPIGYRPGCAWNYYGGSASGTNNSSYMYFIVGTAGYDKPSGVYCYIDGTRIAYGESIWYSVSRVASFVCPPGHTYTVTTNPSGNVWILS